MSDGKNGKTNGVEFDFLPIGQAIKKARETNGTTREQLAEQLDYAARHIQSIENEGQHACCGIYKKQGFHIYLCRIPAFVHLVVNYLM